MMFYQCSSLLSAPELPATELSGNVVRQEDYTMEGSCYANMFWDCTSLVNPPSVLPALTVTEWSYNGMFYGCTSLTISPVVSATTVGSVAMGHMFDGCTSLLAGPDLMATTLKSRAYYWMFYGCSNLSSIKCMVTNVYGVYNPFGDWVHGVASTGTFTKDANATFWTSGDSGIPNNWTIQNE